MKAIPNWIKLLIKIAVSVLCLWYVSRKIHWLETWQLLAGSHKLYLLLAVLFFVLSKVVSAFRLNLYFRNIQIDLPEKTNLRLYWLGMFYNLFLPGGIGGDAYKVILLHQKGYVASYKKTTAAVLLDRVSGVAGLGILAAVFYFVLFKGTQYSWWILAAIIPGLAVYWFGVKKIFASFIDSFWSTLALGLAVQLLQIVCIWCLMQSIGLQESFFAFQFVFLLSSIVAILPFTIGGLGAREIVFLWGAEQFALDQHQAVYISLLFYVITALVSLVGMIWVFRNPLPEKKPAI